MLMLQCKDQGKLPFKQVVKCGCEQSNSIEKILCLLDTCTLILAFSPEPPCCGFQHTNIFDVFQDITKGYFDFTVLPPYGDYNRTVSF